MSFGTPVAFDRGTIALSRAPNYRSAIAAGIFGFVLAAMVIRIFYGTDHTDEAFYIALPYRFWLGDRMFLDEYWVSQLAAPLIEPVIAAYLAIVGSTAGIVLCFRGLYLLLALATACLFVWVLRSRPTIDAAAIAVPTPTAILVGAFWLAEVPFSLFGLGYDQLGTNFLAQGFLLLMQAQVNDTRPRTWLRVAAGVLHGLAVVCYPTLPLAVLPLAIPLLMLRGHFRASALAYAAGLLLGGGWILAIVAATPLTAIHTAASYVFSFGTEGGGIEKLLTIGFDCWRFLPHQPWLLALAVTALLSRRVFPPARYLLLTTPFLLIGQAAPPYAFYGSLLFVRNVALVGPLAFLALPPRDNAATRVFFMMWCPGIVAGLVTAWSSENAAWNFGLAGLIAAVASCILFWFALAAPPNASNVIGRRRWPAELVGMACLIAFVIPTLAFSVSAAYGEVVLADATTPIRSGPLRGIRTSPSMAAFYNDIGTDLTKLPPRSTILFTDNFIIGYLFTRMRPLVPSLWFPDPAYAPSADRGALTTYLARRGALPDYIVRIDLIPYTPSYHVRNSLPPKDPVMQLIESTKYKLVVRTRFYSIFTRE